MINFKRFILLFASLMLLVHTSVAQMLVTNAAPYNTVNHLINNVFSDGTVTINNIQIFGQAGQYGYFNNGMTAVGMDSGIVLSTWDLASVSSSPSAPSWGFPAPGNVNNTTGLNFGFPWMGTASSNNLLSVSASVPALLGASFGPASDVNSACAITFDFVPTQDTMAFKFCFTSDEWNTYPCSQFNDVFGFFVAGPGITGTYNSPLGFPNAANVAFVPGTNIPITISSITHPTQTGSCSQAYNTQYYLAGNSGGLTMNAKTTVIEIKFPVQVCQTYNFTMAIANAGDVGLQSAVFMEGNSFGGTSPFNAVIQPTYNTIGGDSIIYEGCAGIEIVFERNDTLLAADSIPLNIFGSAIPGLDTDPIPDTLFFAQGQDSLTVYFNIPDDGLVEGSETLYVAIDDTTIQIGCGSFQGDTLMITIEDAPLITADPTVDTVMCTNAPVNLLANPLTGIGPFTYQWSTGDTIDSIFAATPTTTTDYYVTLTDACSLYTYVDTATIVIQNPPTSIDAPGDTIDCEDVGAVVLVNVNNPMPGLNYQWSTGFVSTQFYQMNPFVTTDYYITVTQNCAGYNLIDTFTLVVDNPPFTLNTRDDTINCTSDSIDIWVDVSYTTPGFTFQWNNGVTDSVQTVKPQVSTEYYVSVTDACGQLTVVDTVTVWVINEPIVTSRENKSIPCAGDVVTIGPEVSGGYYPYSYQWSNGVTDSSQVVTSGDTSVFTVSVTDICGTDTAIEQITVTVQTYDPLQIIPFENDTVDCVGDVFEFGAATVIGGSGDYLVSWTNWQDQLDILWGIADSTRIFTIQAADNCNLDSTSAQIVVAVPNYDPLRVVLPGDTFACPDDELPLLASASGGDGDYAFRWNNGREGNAITASPLGPNNYTVTVTDGCGLTASDEIFIDVAVPEANFEGQFIDGNNIIFTNLSIGATYYLWDFGDGNQSDTVNPWHEYLQSQVYGVTLLAYNDYGCVDSVAKEFTPPLRAYIPTAFTPNGDGINDVFRMEGDGIRDIGQIKKFSIAIFDRWGNEVFSSNSPAFEWDGTYKGEPVSLGPYVYTIFIEGYSLQKIEQTGTVNVVQ